MSPDATRIESVGDFLENAELNFEASQLTGDPFIKELHEHYCWFRLLMAAIAGELK